MKYFLLLICHSRASKALKCYQLLCLTQILHSSLSVFPSTFCEASLGVLLAAVSVRWTEENKFPFQAIRVFISIMCLCACAAKHTFLNLMVVLEPKSSKNFKELFRWKFFCLFVWLFFLDKGRFYSTVYLPLGAATGPTAQGLICAEFRETNRTFDNTGGSTDTLRPGTQVGVKKKSNEKNRIWILLFTDEWRWISAVAALTAPSWSFTGPWVLRMYLPPDLCVQLAGSLRLSLTEPFSWSSSDPQTVPLVLSSPGAKAGQTQVTF